MEIVSVRAGNTTWDWVGRASVMLEGLTTRARFQALYLHLKKLGMDRREERMEQGNLLGTKLPPGCRDSTNKARIRVVIIGIQGRRAVSEAED